MAFNCVDPNGVPYTIDAGEAHVTTESERATVTVKLWLTVDPREFWTVTVMIALPVVSRSVENDSVPVLLPPNSFAVKLEEWNCDARNHY